MGKFRRTAHSICNLRFNVPNEIHAVFQNGSNYEYHFIMKQLANQFKGQFEFLQEKQRKQTKEKYKTQYLVPIEKGIKKIDKEGNEDITTVSNKMEFMDGASFMASSLSNPVDIRNS